MKKTWNYRLQLLDQKIKLVEYVLKMLWKKMVVNNDLVYYPIAIIFFAFSAFENGVKQNNLTTILFGNNLISSFIIHHSLVQ